MKIYYSSFTSPYLTIDIPDPVVVPRTLRHTLPNCRHLVDLILFWGVLDDLKLYKVHQIHSNRAMIMLC